MTDEQIIIAGLSESNELLDFIYENTTSAEGVSERLIAYARAVEAAATAPLLERIAELTKDRDLMERYWNEAMATHENIAALKFRIAELKASVAELEAKLAQRVPEWNGLVEGERNQIVDAICEYGTGFVTPLYAIVEGIERKLMERNAAPAAPEQQEPPPKECQTPRACSYDGVCRGSCKLVAQAPNAQQAEAQEPFAWSVFDGEGGHDLVLYAGNEDYRERFEARNPNHKNWVEPLFTRPQPAQLQALSEGDVLALYQKHNTSWIDGFTAAVRDAESALAAKNGVNLK